MNRKSVRAAGVNVMTEIMQTEPSTEQPAASDKVQQSTAYAKAPKLSHRALTVLLVVMCVVPVVLLTTLFIYLPKVNEGFV